MIEVWLFGWRLLTLPSGGAVVLLLLALSSVTYLAMTLAPALSSGRAANRRARAVGLVAAGVTLAAALLGVRVGPPGSGGEALPSLAVGVAAAAAIAAVIALVALTGGASAARLEVASGERRARLQSARKKGRLELEASRRAFLEGEDLRVEVRGREEAIARLHAAVEKLSSTEALVESELGSLEDTPHGADLGAELRRTRDEVRAKVELGRRIEEAAVAAAFRVSCGAPVRLLLRRRPRDLGLDIAGDGAAGVDGADPSALRSKLTAAASEIDRFLGEADGARLALADLEADITDGSDGAEVLAQATRDVAAVEDAFRRVRERLAVVAVRVGARADMEALAAVAGEVSDKARANGVPADDLAALVDELGRAESALAHAAPADMDSRALSETLARSAAVLGGEDEASLEELLRALHEVG